MPPLVCSGPTLAELSMDWKFGSFRYNSIGVSDFVEISHSRAVDTWHLSDTVVLVGDQAKYSQVYLLKHSFRHVSKDVALPPTNWLSTHWAPMEYNAKRNGLPLYVLIELISFHTPWPDCAWVVLQLSCSTEMTPPETEPLLPPTEAVSLRWIQWVGLCFKQRLRDFLVVRALRSFLPQVRRPLVSCALVTRLVVSEFFRDHVVHEESSWLKTKWSQFLWVASLAQRLWHCCMVLVVVDFTGVSKSLSTARMQRCVVCTSQESEVIHCCLELPFSHCVTKSSRCDLRSDPGESPAVRHKCSVTEEGRIVSWYWYQDCWFSFLDVHCPIVTERADVSTPASTSTLHNSRGPSDWMIKCWPLLLQLIDVGTVVSPVENILEALLTPPHVW